MLMLISVIVVAGNFALDFFEQGIQDRIIFDFGSSLASLLGAFLCLYLTTSQIRGQLDSKQAYFILTSECSRTHFIIGKWLGAIVFTAFNALIIFGEIFLIIYFNSGIFSSLTLIYFYIVALKLSLLGAIAAFFCVTSSLVVAPALSVFIYFIGHWGSYISYALEKSGGSPFILNISGFITGYLLPNFKFYTAEHVITENFEGAAGYLVMLTLYTLAANAIILGAAAMVFKKKDL
jgi:ABC-type transport system involved in multi-copper enzyme maturation permease subunit